MARLVCAAVLVLVALSTAHAAAHRPICELVTESGYPCELHTVMTADGFELGVNRIPPKIRGSPAVVLQHGLLDCGATWVNNMPYQSLGFILHDAGFDVWIGNSRGTTFSQNNANWPKHSVAYWNLIDYDTMAKYDIPALIDYTLQQTGKPSVGYVGHSQGTTQAFAAFTENYGDLAKKVNVFIALAPVAHVGNQKSPVFKKLADDYLGYITHALGVEQFAANSAVLTFFGLVCDYVPLGCDNLLFAIMGPSNPNNINGSRIDYYTHWEPADTSTHNMIHWAQGVRHGKFQMYDWAWENKKHYNQSETPQYDLSKFPTVPVAFFTGSEDWLADPEDVALLRTALGPHIVFEDNQPDYAHLDFVWGINAHQRIYPNVTQLLQHYAA